MAPPFCRPRQGRLRRIADFNIVETAAARLHPEGAEKRLLGFQGLDAGNFGAATPAPQLDFFVVGAPPSHPRRRTIEYGARPSTFATFGARLHDERSSFGFRIGVLVHAKTLCPGDAASIELGRGERVTHREMVAGQECRM